MHNSREFIYNVTKAEAVDTMIIFLKLAMREQDEMKVDERRKYFQNYLGHNYHCHSHQPFTQ
jgi:hypothetical protein